VSNVGDEQAENEENYVVMTKNTFDIQKSVQENLSEEDQKMYGAFARCPEGYSKIDVLGKGGCAVVWLCQDKQTG